LKEFNTANRITDVLLANMLSGYPFMSFASQKEGAKV